MKKKAKPIQEPTFLLEEQVYQKGHKILAGVDEAGRGPLAGPVVAAAIILPEKLDKHILAGLRDSKQLNEISRLRYYQILTKIAPAYAVAQASVREIETINIRQATLLAMKRAIEKLHIQPDYVVIDGKDFPDITFPGEAVIGGDESSITIGAASIIAKVIRDRIMTAMHHRHSQYGFDHNKGYPTVYHRTALKIFGPCPQHRKTYAGVSDLGIQPKKSQSFLQYLKEIGQSTCFEHIDTLKQQLTKLQLTDNERYYLEHRIHFQAEYLSRKERLLHPSTSDKGFEAEQYVIDCLQKQGYQLWERNFHGSKGEIDLIMNKGTQIIFVEVKSRKSDKFGMPYEAVNKKKRKAIIQTAEEYLFHRDLNEFDIRYDIASILTNKNPPQMEYFEDAFRVEEDFT